MIESPNKGEVMKRFLVVLATLAMLAFALPAQAVTLTATDVAVSVGITGKVNDQFSNNVMFKFPDGSDGMMLSGHVEAISTVYKRNAQHWDIVQTFPAGIDRHGCDWGDLNNDTRPDIVCSVGAQHGTSNNKSNEVWLMDADSDHFTLSPDAFGMIDTSGRGRDAHVFDYDNDGFRDDVFIGNAFPEDFPSPNRMYVSDGTTMHEVTALLPKAYSGAICIGDADFNRDGRQDVYAAGAPDRVLLQTAAGGLTWNQSWLPNTKSLGCWAGDINNDSKPDLVTINATTLTVWVNSGTSLVSRYTRSTPGGANIAVVDWDHDGGLDIFVVTSKTGTAKVNAPDQLLMGNPTGITYTPFVGLPAAKDGVGSNVGVVPDWNGYPAFVVTNGNDAPKTYLGSRQFIIFTEGSKH